MYPNLRAEMARRNVTITMLSEALNKSVGTVSSKLKGKYPITIEEAKTIRSAIGADMTIDELFERTEG